MNPVLPGLHPELQPRHPFDLAFDLITRNQRADARRRLPAMAMRNAVL